MKPETQTWLDKLVPLLVHLKEGGELINIHGIAASYSSEAVNMTHLYGYPHQYRIHVEPRVVYLIKNDDGTLHHGASVTDPVGYSPVSQKFLVRFIEDLDWKPEEPK